MSARSTYTAVMAILSILAVGVMIHMALDDMAAELRSADGARDCNQGKFQ